MPLKWSDVVQKQEYLSLVPEDRAMAKNQYFNDIVAPNIPQEDSEFAKKEFMNYATNLDVKEKQPGFIKSMMSGALEKVKRGAGVGIGIINSPLAFVWGSQAAQYEYPEEYAKLSVPEQALVSAGGGLESAWRSISQKEDFGTLFGEYHKIKTGKTVRETVENDIKSAVKWDKLSIDDKAALQTTMDVIAPSVELLMNVIADPIISAGEAARLTQLKVPKHWQGKIDPKVIAEIEKLESLEKIEKIAVQKKLLETMKNRKGYMQWWKDNLDKFDLRERGAPLLKPGEREIPGMTAPQQAIAGTPKRFQTTLHPAETAMAEPKIPLRPDQMVKLKEDRRIRTGIPLIKPKPITAGTYTRATGGAILGIEEDEDGNFRYNIGKGLAGTMLVAGGLNLTGKNKKFMKIISDNPAWEKVHGMIGKEKRSFNFAGLFGKINTKGFDRMSRLEDKSEKAYIAARTFSSYKDQAQLKFQELVDGLSKVKEDEVLFTDYVDAHRAYTRAARGLKNPNNVTLADSKQAIKEIESVHIASGKDVENLRGALNNFQEWTSKYILQDFMNAGLLSKAGFDDIIKNNKWYATFDVLDHLPPDINNLPMGISGEYFSVANQGVIKTMIGTEKKIANPIEATIRKFTQAQETVARNKVANAFIDDPHAINLFRPIAENPKQFKIMQAQGLDPIVQGSWNKKEFGTINRFKDGRVERYLVDADIAEAMKQLSPAQAPKAVQAINAVFRAAATTVYLPFTISNAARDALMAYTTAPVYTALRPDKFVVDWSKGFWEGAKHEFLGSSDLAKEYIKSGGGFGYVGNLRKANFAKSQLFKKGLVKQSTDIVTSPLKLIEKISATIELAPRLGTFERAKMVGMTGEDAALMARQSTIDFNRGGTWTKVANQWIPFLNARFQSRVVLAQALKRDPKNTIAKIAVAVGIPGLATYAWNRLYHSDLYDDIPEYIKQNYFVIITGKGKDERGVDAPQYLVISKGDVGQMAWNPVEFGLDKMWEKDTESAKKFLVNYLSDLSPVEFARQGELSLSKAAGGLLPPVVKGFAEDWANLNLYTGREIVPHYMGKSKPPELQYKENTPETYKWLGKKLDVAPLRLQNFASNILAGYGREGLDPSAMLRGLTGRLVKTKGGEHEQQAWTTIKDVEQGYVYTRAYAEQMVENGDRNGAAKLLREWNNGLRLQINEYNKKFSKYGFEDKGGLRNSYLFTPDKMKNIFLKREEEGTALQKKLRR